MSIAPTSNLLHALGHAATSSAGAPRPAQPASPVRPVAVAAKTTQRTPTPAPAETAAASGRRMMPRGSLINLVV
jgi:hypothetical protein